MKKPLIGIIVDFRDGGKEGYSKRPYYALSRDYVSAINKAGGATVLFPYDYEAIDDYLEMIDGLMIVGGYFDIDPRRYGETKIHPEVRLNKTREDFEDKVASKALAKGNLPILGICNGMQVINVATGGNMIQHIPDLPGVLNHEQSHDPDYDCYSKAYHEIKIEKDTKLFAIVGVESTRTNSSHHQGTKEVADEIKVSARASDGIIEAIEHKTHPFCIGVQWHPERCSSEVDVHLFTSFVEAAREYRKK